MAAAAAEAVGAGAVVGWLAQGSVRGCGMGAVWGESGDVCWTSHYAAARHANARGTYDCTPVRRRNAELRAAVASGALPAFHPAAYYDQHTAAAAALAADLSHPPHPHPNPNSPSPYLDHLAWLLALSPRLAQVLQVRADTCVRVHVCGCVGKA